MDMEPNRSADNKNNIYTNDEEYLAARARRQARRMERMKRERLRAVRLALVSVLLLVLVIFLAAAALKGCGNSKGSAGAGDGRPVSSGSAEGPGNGSGPSHTGSASEGPGKGISEEGSSGPDGSAPEGSAPEGSGTENAIPAGSLGTAGNEVSGSAASESSSARASISIDAKETAEEVRDLAEGYTCRVTGNTKEITSEDVQSEFAVLVDCETGEIVAEKNSGAVISPASMTKILTVLVAAEHVEDPDDTFTMTLEITDYVYRHDGSAAGFMPDETVPVRDLFYGTILPSGADAALGLATYVAGSQEDFVKLMNEKVEELGLSETAHFTNVAGLYDEDLHCTPRDMAMILKAAVENDFAREVLSAHRYTTSKTEAHPEGIALSNWFLRRIEDKDCHGTVLCAKTGFVSQSGNCAASFQISNSGGRYICVTGNAHSAWRAIYDHVAVYDLYTS